MLLHSAAGWSTDLAPSWSQDLDRQAVVRFYERGGKAALLWAWQPASALHWCPGLRAGGSSLPPLAGAA